MSALVAPLCSWCLGCATLDQTMEHWVCQNHVRDRIVRGLGPDEVELVTRLTSPSLRAAAKDVVGMMYSNDDAWFALPKEWKDRLVALETALKVNS